MRVGIIAIQGAVSEHIDAVRKAINELGLEGEAVPVRKKEDLEDIQGLILPGGESTTISKLLVSSGMSQIIKDKVKNGMPIMGTCAGCILLANEGDLEVEKSETVLLELMDMKVERNAFGRQRESFELSINIHGFDSPYKAVFIRAPAIVRVWGECRALASIEKKIVLAIQKNMIATAFHPELTNDMRIHGQLLKMIMNHDF
jgi:5'-phosphate synthase pdxT subunit